MGTSFENYHTRSAERFRAVLKYLHVGRVGNCSKMEGSLYNGQFFTKSSHSSPGRQFFRVPVRKPHIRKP